MTNVSDLGSAEITLAIRFDRFIEKENIFANKYNMGPGTLVVEYEAERSFLIESTEAKQKETVWLNLQENDEGDIQVVENDELISAGGLDLNEAMSLLLDRLKQLFLAQLDRTFKLDTTI